MTNAEIVAHLWGERMADDDMDIVTLLSRDRRDPGELLTRLERLAWERLGPERFWRWALAGHGERVRHLDGVE